MSGDTIRDELAAKVRARIDDWRIACDPADDHGPSLDDAIVDAVLDWLGGLDPGCDRDLLVWHLRNDRGRIGFLVREADLLRDEIRRLQDELRLSRTKEIDAKIECDDALDEIAELREALRGAQS